MGKEAGKGSVRRFGARPQLFCPDRPIGVSQVNVETQRSPWGLGLTWHGMVSDLRSCNESSTIITKSTSGQQSPADSENGMSLRRQAVVHYDAHGPPCRLLRVVAFDCLRFLFFTNTNLRSFLQFQQVFL